MSAGLEDGDALRTDTTVVEADILRTAVRKTSNAEHIVTRSWAASVCPISPYGLKV